MVEEWKAEKMLYCKSFFVWMAENTFAEDLRRWEGRKGETVEKWKADKMLSFKSLLA